MAKYKVFTLNIDEEQKKRFKDALLNGSPLSVALAYARIPAVQYYYYVEVANITRYFKEMEFVRLDDDTIKAGVSFADIRDESKELTSFTNNRNSAIGTYKEPSEKAKLRYKQNRTFKAFADEVYEFITECDNLRAQAVYEHLEVLKKCAGQKNVDTKSSMWFLEKSCPEHFGDTKKIINKIEGNMHNTFTAEGDADKPSLPPIKVEFINPNSTESLNRLKDMENKVIQQTQGKDAA